MVLRGDVDDDEIIGTLDASKILSHITEDVVLNPSQVEAADVTGEGEVDTKDVKHILRADLE